MSNPILSLLISSVEMRFDESFELREEPGYLAGQFAFRLRFWAVQYVGVLIGVESTLLIR